MSNFDLKKYLAEGKLHEEVDQTEAEAEAQKLIDVLGVMVAPSPNNYSDEIRLRVYPDSEPGDRFYNSRSAQGFSLVAKDGKYFFSSAGGYRRSMEPIARVFGLDVEGNTGIAGRYQIDANRNKREVNLVTIKMIVNYMQQGLKDESKAQGDFYKGWANPD
jgi:hypothetical protein